MTRQLISLGTLDEFPRVSRNLTLICSKCGTRAVYDVGTIFFDIEGEGDAETRHFSFTNYFRCQNCHSAGPWEIDDSMKMLGLALRAKVDSKFEGLRQG